MAANRRPNHIPLTITRGEHRVLTGTVTDLDGAPVSIDGCVMHAVFRERETDAEAVLELSTGDGITHLAQSGGTLGKYEMTLESADTMLFDPHAHVYAVWVVDALDRPQPVIDQSKVTVVRGIYEPV